MFGRDWERAEAVIVMRHVKKTSGDGSVVIYEYVADVSPSNGAPFRATLQEPGISTNFWPPSMGDRVGVLMNEDRDKVKFDKDDPRVDAKARMAEQKQMFEAASAQAPGTDAFVPTMGTTTVIGASDDMRATIQAALAAAAQRITNGSAAPDVASRLAQLDALHGAGALTDAEHATARARIIAEI
jgi:hypothetical protein